MPTINADGTVTPRSSAGILAAIVEALAQTSRFGPAVRDEHNNIRLMVEAAFALPFDQQEAELVSIAARLSAQNALTTADVEAQTDPLFQALPPVAATGIVEISYKSPLPTSPTPIWAAGEIDFIDASGARHRLDSDIDPPTAMFDSNETGTASETVGAVNTKIAQKFSSPETVSEFVQAVRLLATVVSGTPTARISIETDSAGSPSGVLADARLRLTLQAIANATVTEAVFEQGAYLEEDSDYWVVIDTIAGGTFTLDGGAGGTADRVKFYNGAVWANSATIENANMEVVRGGIAEVEAVELGEAGNIEAGSISNVRFANTPAQTAWNNLVDSFENIDPFAGGRGVETVPEMQRRIRLAKSARETGSLDSIITYFQNGNVAGVTSADGIENETDDWGTQDEVVDNSSETGTTSEAIDGTTTRAAYKFTTAEYGSASQFALDFVANTGFVFTGTIQTDAAGDPSGTLADSNLTGSFTPIGTGRKVFAFEDGAFLAAGTYWLVVERTAGSATFDGSTAGSAGDFKVYAGSWANAAVMESPAWEIFGGLPPHSFRIYVEGGHANDIAQGIHDLKAAGIYADGSQLGNATNVAGSTVERRFSEPISVPIVIRIEANVGVDFTGDEDTLRDLTAEYLAELGVSEDFDYDELRARLIHGDTRTEGVKLTMLRIGRKSSFASPAALTSAEVVDLSASTGEKFAISNDATDISVTLTAV